MWEVNWSHDGRRPLLDVLIFSALPDDLRSVATRALIDTGATASAITRSIADQLHLPVIGKRLIGSAHGEQLVDRHMFRVGLSMEGQAYPFLFEPVEGF